VTADRAPSQVWDSNRYDGQHAYVWQYGAELLELLAPQAGERIVDLGSGTGHLAARIAEAGAEVVGLDASDVMVEQARRNYPALSFNLGDAADFRFDAPFDAVFSNATLHWVRRAEEAITCIAKALKPGGRFVAEFGGHSNVDSVVRAIYGAREAAGLDAGHRLNPWFYPSIAQYTGLLDKHGMEVTYARLFDRPTRLDPGEGGLRSWLDMFGGSFFSDLDAGTREAVIEDIERRLRSSLYEDGAWTIDYRRLRIIGVKLSEAGAVGTGRLATDFTD
jgi:trans-aconitate 2-methyltransferase